MSRDGGVRGALVRGRVSFGTGAGVAWTLGRLLQGCLVAAVSCGAFTSATVVAQTAPAGAPAAAIDVASVLDDAVALEGDARLDALGAVMDAAAVDGLGAAVDGASVPHAALALVALAEVGDAGCEVIVEAPSHADPVWRVAAANASARCGDLAPLRALLDDDDPTLRLKAAVTLGVIGDADSEDAVLAMVGDPTYEGHTAFVALAAGLLGREEARDALDVLLLHGPTRLHAALALSRLGTDDVILDLVFALDDVSDPILRHAILDEVVHRLPPTGREAVTAMAASDPSPRIAEAAARAARRWLHLRPRDGRITSSPPARTQPRPD